MEYKNNHTIPRAILNNWITEANSRKGVYVYEIEKDKQYFSTSEGKRGFSFAISNDLYVPSINGKRNTNLERWKGDLENTLSIFIKKIKNKERNGLAKDQSDINKIISALISINTSSEYDLTATHKYLEQNPEYKKLISGQPEREVKTLTLENIVNSINEKVLSYNNIEVTVCTSNKDNPFIYTDRPFLNEVFDGRSFIVVSNNIVISFIETLNVSTINYIDCSCNLVNSINTAMAQLARKWIIASNEETLNKYKLVVNSPDWLESKNNDKVLYQPVRFITYGSYFNEI